MMATMTIDKIISSSVKPLDRDGTISGRIGRIAESVALQANADACRSAYRHRNEQRIIRIGEPEGASCSCYCDAGDLISSQTRNRDSHDVLDAGQHLKAVVVVDVVVQGARGFADVGAHSTLGDRGAAAGTYGRRCRRVHVRIVRVAVSEATQLDFIEKRRR